MTGWILVVLICVFGLVGGAPFSPGVMLAAYAFFFSLLPTWQGALVPGVLCLASMAAALHISILNTQGQLWASQGWVTLMVVGVAAFAVAFWHGLRVRRMPRTAA